MPIKVVKDLPAIKQLQKENIFVMDESRALSQDIRPLKLIILNLMPTKEATELQLLRTLSNSPLQQEVTFLRAETHEAANTSEDYLKTFYQTFSQIKDNYYDGLIITGAPVELLDFKEVDYWEELQSIFSWSKKHVFTTLHICWGAQAGLYFHYGIDKVRLEKKLFGIFKSFLLKPNDKLLTGFDEVFYMPHSRHTFNLREDLLVQPKLEILAESDEAGVTIVKSTDNKEVYIFGHAEYAKETLGLEYLRDLKTGLDISLPENYYPENDPSQPPLMNWRSSAGLLFTNWLNYYVYQETPYHIENIQVEHLKKLNLSNKGFRAKQRKDTKK